MPGHLERGIHTTGSNLEYLGVRVLGGGIDDRVQPDLLRQPDSIRAYLSANHLGRTHDFTDARGKETDRAHARDEHRLILQWTGHRSVHGVPKSVLKAGNLRGNVSRRGARVFRRDNHVFRKTPVYIDTKDNRVHADVSLPGAALFAPTADNVGLAGNKIPHRATGNAFTYLDDRAAKLMPDNSWRHDSGSRPRIPCVDVEIGTADAGCFEFDLHVARSNTRFRRFDDFDPRRRTGLRDGFHSDGKCTDCTSLLAVGNNARMETGTKIRVAVVGAAGRMGTECLRAIDKAPDLELVAAIDKPGANLDGFAGIELEDKLGAALDRSQPQVLVDFTSASASPLHAESALKRRIAPIIGATGLDQQAVREIRRLTQEHGTPAMIVPNFAIGAVLMMRFAEIAARWLPDAEIIEMHHEKKEDAPSGTSIRTAELIGAARTGKPTHMPRPLLKVQEVRGGTLQDVHIHSIRLPGLVAHQQVIFGGEGETLTLRHDSTSRTSFMKGVALCIRKVHSLNGLTIGMEELLFHE
jgi:4-hydroxy-tetrahydrodipicolinate reductase